MLGQTRFDRRRYADHLAAVLPPTASILLITFEYGQDEMEGLPFSVSSDEVAALYPDFAATVVADVDRLATTADLACRGLTRLRERATVLRRA